MNQEDVLIPKEEGNNERLIRQSKSPKPYAEKKWFLALFATIFIGLFGSLIFFKDVIKKNTGACKIAIEQKHLKKVRSCEEEVYPLEGGGEVSMVTILYGEGSSCPAGCIYQQYLGVVDGGYVYDFFTNRSEPDTMLSSFGSYCRDTDWERAPGAKSVSIAKSGGLQKYVWKYSYENYHPVPRAILDTEFVNGVYGGEVIVNCPPAECPHLKEVMPECVLNGSLYVFSDQIGGVDASSLEWRFEYLPTKDICSQEKLSKTERTICFDNLSAATGDEFACYKGHPGSCRKNIALQKRDPHICNEISQTYYGSFRSSCRSAASNASGNPEVCSSADDIWRLHCEGGANIGRDYFESNNKTSAIQPSQVVIHTAQMSDEERETVAEQVYDAKVKCFTDLKEAQQAPGRSSSLERFVSCPHNGEIYVNNFTYQRNYLEKELGWEDFYQGIDFSKAVDYGSLLRTNIDPDEYCESMPDNLMSICYEALGQ